MMKIPIAKPYFDGKEAKAVAEVLKSGWVTQGPKGKEFEEKIASFTGAKQAVACSSATTGLHLALAALGVGSGDEVIVPSFTWLATANVALYQGAKPVFADIDLSTFNIDEALIEKAVTKKTKAIIPVHLFGLAANMGKIMAIAKKYRLYVIEDAACALGTTYQGKHVGLFGNCGVISFHPRKSITTGEGGMIITDDLRLAQKVKSLRDHGSEPGKFGSLMPEFNQLGYNYRLTDIQAAIGIEQLKKYPKILAKKKKLAIAYDKALKNHPYLITPITTEYSTHSYQAYVVRIKKDSPLNQKELSVALAKEGVQTRPGTQNVPTLGLYRKLGKYKQSDFPRGSEAEDSTLAIPFYFSLTKKELDYVTEKLFKVFQ